MTKKTINPKYMPTKTLRSFIDNDYVGVDGLDREQYKDEINDLYFERTTKEFERALDRLLKELDESIDHMPPEFRFLYDPTADRYISMEEN